MSGECENCGEHSVDCVCITKKGNLMIDVDKLKSGIEELKKFQDLNLNSSIVKWIIQIGEAKAKAANMLQKWHLINEALAQTEHDIPQFHKQPGSFAKMKEGLAMVRGQLNEISQLLTPPDNEWDDEEDDDY